MVVAFSSFVTPTVLYKKVLYKKIHCLESPNSFIYIYTYTVWWRSLIFKKSAQSDSTCPFSYTIPGVYRSFPGEPEGTSSTGVVYGTLHRIIKGLKRNALLNRLLKSTGHRMLKSTGHGMLKSTQLANQWPKAAPLIDWQPVLISTCHGLLISTCRGLLISTDGLINHSALILQCRVLVGEPGFF